MTRVEHEQRGTASARERAYESLRQRILLGHLAPGTTLLESEVASLLSMSRTPVREALIMLEGEHLIDIRPRRGMTVRRQSLQDLMQIYEVFSALEAMACRIVAREGLAPGVHARLSQLMTAMERATEREDVAGWSELDDAFHSAIAEASGNDRLRATLRTYWAEQFRARMAIVPYRPLPVRSNVEHRRLVDGLLSGDEFLAARLLQSHREHADAMAIELFRTHALSG